MPRGGERNDIPPHELGLDNLVVCQNMVRNRKGELVLRPGYRQFVTPGPAQRIMALTYYRTTALADRTVAGTLLGWWQFNGVSWADISGTALTGTSTDEVRFAVFPEGTPIVYNLIGVNNVDSPKVWDGAAATYSALGGSPPTAADITVASNRVLMLVRPNTIRVSAINNSASWPAANAAILPDAGDILIGMERMSRTTVGILGDRSQWIAKPQQGTFPFRFDIISEQPGPVSARAIVRWGNSLYYLADDGNVYQFDGVVTKPVGAAMEAFVAENLNFTLKAMSHGFYLYEFGLICWLFPSATATSPDYGIYYNPRTQEMGRLLFGTSITASSIWKSVALIKWSDLSSYTWANIAATYPTWASFGSAAQKSAILGDLNGQVHMVGLGSGSDNGGAVEGIWEFPLLSPGGVDKAFRPATFESWFEKTVNSTTVETSVGSTDTLMASRSLTPAANIDIQTDQRNDIDLATLDLEKRFTTIRHRVSTTTGNTRWKGGVLSGDIQKVEGGPT